MTSTELDGLHKDHVYVKASTLMAMFSEEVWPSLNIYPVALANERRIKLR